MPLHKISFSTMKKMDDIEDWIEIYYPHFRYSSFRIFDKTYITARAEKYDELVHFMMVWS